jgi:hypothetical protein
MTTPEEMATEFLSRWNLRLEDLARYVRPLESSETLLLVGSITDGLANPLSDVDLVIIGESDFEEGLVIKETEYTEWATNLPNGPEINVEYWRAADLEQIEKRLTSIFSLVQDPSVLEGPSQLKQLERFSDSELRLLHRIRRGAVLVNRENAESLRQRLLLDHLPYYLILHQMSYHNLYREDTIAQVRYGDPLSALYMLRTTMDYFAGVMLASAGETNTYSKWRVRLLDRHKDVLGSERVETMTRYLFPDPKSNASETVREALNFANETFDDILTRCPEIVPALSAMNNLFPFVKEVDEVFQQERSATESGT